MFGILYSLCNLWINSSKAIPKPGELAAAWWEVGRLLIQGWCGHKLASPSAAPVLVLWDVLPGTGNAAWKGEEVAVGSRKGHGLLFCFWHILQVVRAEEV